MLAARIHGSHCAFARADGQTASAERSHRKPLWVMRVLCLGASTTDQQETG